MAYKLLLSLGHGNLEEGFPNISVSLWEEGKDLIMKVNGRLPSNLDLLNIYQRWQFLYLAIYQNNFSNLRIEFLTEEGDITNISIVDLKQIAQQIQQTLNQWLNRDSFNNIEKQLRTKLSTNSEIAIIIESDDFSIQKIPWHLWDFVTDYPYSEVAFSAPEFQQIELTQYPRGKVRILAIFGNDDQINLKCDREVLNQLPRAEITLISEPSREELNNLLWDKIGWDIIFFAGHSYTKDNQGYIKLNQTDNLTIQELKQALTTAIYNGLQLAIFNSCDGLGLAHQLSQLQIPQIIVMREPIADLVAHDFLAYFLNSYVQEISLYLALRKTRNRLEGKESDFPCASWLPIICQNPASVSLKWQDLGRPLPANFCPYQGLLAFSEENANYFFGRDNVIQQLIRRIQKQNFIAIIGSSGSGKSSLVYGGLIPHLRQQKHWQIYSFRPSEYSIHDLAIIQDNGQKNDKYLIFIDQFEEIYILSQSSQQQQQFLDQILGIIKDKNCHVLITLRIDYLETALTYRPFADALQDADLKLSGMNPQELETIITKPAAIVGVKIENGLTEKILQAVATQPGNLPLLEFALTQLWAKKKANYLTHSAYQEIGGVEGALANYAENIYQQLSATQQALVKQIFLQLIHIDNNNKPTKRPMSKTNLVAGLSDIEARSQVINYLANKKLIVIHELTINQEKVTVIDLTHEALISYWLRLDDWVQNNQSQIKQLRKIEALAEEWLDKNKSKNPSYLLQSDKLKQAENLSKNLSPNLSLSPLVREFIAQSNHIQQQRTYLLSGVVLILLSLSFYLMGYFNRQEKLTRIREQIAVADFIYPVKPLEGLIISINAAGKSLSNLSEIIPLVEDNLKKGLELSKEINQIQFDRYPRAVAISLDNQYLITGLDDHTVRLFDWQGKLFDVLRGHKNGIKTVAISPNNQYIASAGSDRTIRLWNIKGQQLKVLLGHEKVVMSVAISPNNQYIASASMDKTIRLWDLEGEQLAIFKGHEALIYAVNFSPNGQYIVSGGLDETIRIWNLKGEQLAIFKGHEGRIYSVSFSPNGQYILSGSADGTIRLWDLQGDPVLVIDSYQGLVYTVAFSPNGQYIASGGANGNIKIWDIQGNLITTLIGHEKAVNSVVFSPDNNFLVSSSYDETIRIWDLTKPELNDHIQGLKISCDRFKNHPSLENPKNPINQGAKETCKKYGN